MKAGDLEWMQRALGLARGGLGRVWPNPSVGCVLVKDGALLGEACTGPGGRPHAEQLALSLAGDAARGATAYVSLEPCNHFGVTPPCSAALCEAGVARVVVAVRDPDPRVDGAGIAHLRARGVQVVEGVCEADAWALNAGFFMRVRFGRPRVVVAALPSDPLERTRFVVASGHDATLATAETGLAVVLLHPRQPGEATWRVLPHAAVDDARVVTVEDLAGDAGPGACLSALGARGLTSVVVDAADPFVARLRGAGLVDQELA